MDDLEHAVAPSAKPVPTPESVPDVTPSLCLSLIEFKGMFSPIAKHLPAYTDMLRQFRAIDDGVTLRLNRAFAQSRDLGSSSPPSLLQRHDKSFSSSSAADLGRSTYAVVSETMCESIWSELALLWKRREDTIRYCIDINAQTQQQRNAAPLSQDDRLDLDRAKASPIETSEVSLSRGESTADFTTRQLRNELSIEAIVRRRSLDGTSQ